MHRAAATHHRAARLAARAFLSAFALLVCVARVAAQTPIPDLRLKSLRPGGVQSHLSEGWGMLSFAVANSTPEDKQVRLLSFHPAAPGQQYGRDVWVPAKSTLGSWSRISGPPKPPERSYVELKSLLYDRTAGRERLVRSPDGPPVHSELVSFHRNEPGTTLMLDVDVADGTQGATSARDDRRASEIRDLVRIFRHRQGWTARVNTVKQRFLPPVAEAFDGINHFVLGSDRIVEDAAGLRALRGWLERGGTLWVLLDRVQRHTVATLLGDVLDFHVVDRISVTTMHLRGGPDNIKRVEKEPTELEQPVDFVRVVAPQAQMLYTQDGWPAAFQTDVGRGRVLVTTLGARGWMRPRTAGDPKSRYAEHPNLSIALAPFELLTEELQPRGEPPPPLGADDLRPFVSDQIGYSVVSRDTVVSVFVSLFLVLSLSALALSRQGLLEHLGWLGTSLALAAAGTFIGLGEWSRSAVPTTMAVTQLVDAASGLDEASATGCLGVYQPAAAAINIGAEQGGDFDLDVADLAGRDHRRVQTDLDCWHWENLELPAGVRLGQFRHTVRTAEPLEATVRFGPEGIEGRLTLGPFRHAEDAILSTPGEHALAARLNADGTVLAGVNDELPPGQWLASGLLTDRQRARQSLYAKLLAEPQPRFIAHRHLLLAWADPVDMHFSLAAEPRRTGAALLLIPLRFQRTPPGTRVTIPPAFVDCKRLTTEGQSFRAASYGRDSATVRFRFQVPVSVLPLEVESARLTVKMTAAGREVVVNALPGGEPVPLRKLAGPLGVESIEIDDPRLLRLDDQGTFHINLVIGDAHGAEQDQWRIGSLGLEVRGQTLKDGRAKHEPR